MRKSVSKRIQCKIDLSIVEREQIQRTDARKLEMRNLNY